MPSTTTAVPGWIDDLAVASMLGMPIQGRIIWCSARAGSDNLDGSKANPVRTLATAFGLAQSGRGDVIVLMPYTNTASTTSQYLTSNFDWNKDNTHLIGLGPLLEFSQRARIASSGSTTFPTMFTVSGNGCKFLNVQFCHGIAVDEDQTCLKVTGQRNEFAYCHIAGIGATEPAARAGSETLLLSGAQECVFRNCTIGIDTIPRQAANAEIRTESQATRNSFFDCTILGSCGASGAGHLSLDIPSGGLDRWIKFDNCLFLNPSGFSGATAQTVAWSIHASAGGCVVARRCLSVNITDWGQSSLAWVDPAYDGTDQTTVGGLAVNPTNS